MKIKIEIDWEGDQEVDLDDNFIPELIALLQKSRAASKSEIIMVSPDGLRRRFKPPELH